MNLGKDTNQDLIDRLKYIEREIRNLDWTRAQRAHEYRAIYRELEKREKIAILSEEILQNSDQRVPRSEWRRLDREGAEWFRSVIEPYFGQLCYANDGTTLATVCACGHDFRDHQGELDADNLAPCHQCPCRDYESQTRQDANNGR